MEKFIRPSKNIPLLVLLIISVISISAVVFIPMSSWISLGPYQISDEDTCCPQVTAAFIPNCIENDEEEKEGIFIIEFSATDDTDPNPEITAIFQIFRPNNNENGWTWKLKPISESDENEMKIEIDYETHQVTIKGVNPGDIKNTIDNMGGLEVHNGQRWKIELDYEDDEIEIKFIDDDDDDTTESTGYTIYDPLIYHEVKIEIENFDPDAMITDLLFVKAIDFNDNVGVAYATPSFDDEQTTESETNEPETTEPESTDDSSSWSIPSGWTTPSDWTIPSDWDTDELSSGFEIISIISLIAVCVFHHRRRKQLSE
jgi:hypothetical protein